MKKQLIIALAAMLAVVALAGCASGASSSAASSAASGDASASAASSAAASSEAASSEAVPSAEASSAAVTGGWTMNTEAAANLSAEQKETFEKAMADLDGVDYEPIAVIGGQVVSGMNYAYLCKATVVVPDAQPTWTVVVVYQDIEGKAKFVSAKDIDIADVKTLEESADGPKTGAWAVPDPEDVVDLPKAAQDALDSASENYTGVDIMGPVALLGTQVVAGTNYKVLFVGKPVVPDAANVLYVATVYQDPSNKCELTDVAQVDLEYYVTEDAA